MHEYYPSNQNKPQIQEIKNLSSYTNANIDLDSALSSIKSLMLEKDDKIFTLEEENKILKYKISELESKLKNFHSNNQQSQQSTTTTRNFSNINPNKSSNNSSSNMVIVSGTYKYSPTSLIPSYSNVSNTCTVPNFNTQNNYQNTSSLSTLNSPGNASNPYSPSNLNDSNASRNEIKLFLVEVKEKIPQREFREFIKYIKILTDKNVGGVNRNEIFESVKKLFGRDYLDLYEKFEYLLSIKK